MPQGRNKLAAGLLAIFLGLLGAHKFYLGNSGLGIVYLIGNFFCFLLSFVGIGLFLYAIFGVVVLVEGLVLLAMNDASFNQKYNTDTAPVATNEPV